MGPGDEEAVVAGHAVVEIVEVAGDVAGANHSASTFLTQGICGILISQTRIESLVKSKSTARMTNYLTEFVHGYFPKSNTKSCLGRLVMQPIAEGDDEEWTP